MDTKYIRHSVMGFILWDSKALVTHEQMAKTLPMHVTMRRDARLLSAGFVVFAHGRPHCMGGSTFLNLQAGPDDTAALARQLGLPAEVRT